MSTQVATKTVAPVIEHPAHPTIRSALAEIDNIASFDQGVDLLRDVQSRIRTDMIIGGWMIGRILCKMHEEGTYGNNVIERAAAAVGLEKSQAYACINVAERYEREELRRFIVAGVSWTNVNLLANVSDPGVRVSAEKKLLERPTQTTLSFKSALREVKNGGPRPVRTLPAVPGASAAMVDSLKLADRSLEAIELRAQKYASDVSKAASSVFDPEMPKEAFESAAASLKKSAHTADLLAQSALSVSRAYTDAVIMDPAEQIQLLTKDAALLLQLLDTIEARTKALVEAAPEGHSKRGIQKSIELFSGTIDRSYALLHAVRQSIGILQA